jgi:hypothetical protein
MKTRMLGRFLMAAALLAGASAASTKASANLPQSDSGIAKNVRHEVAMYPWYSLWDDVSLIWPASPMTSRFCRCRPWMTGCGCRWPTPSTATS